MQVRKLILLSSSVLLLFSLAFCVYAHPGGTDENGGHIDKETGEYHYHHGYPSHEHRDIDHDGDVDCPYDFDDQTGKNSGDNSSSYSGVDNYNSSSPQGDQVEVQANVDPTKNNNDSSISKPNAKINTSRIVLTYIIVILITAILLPFISLKNSSIQNGLKIGISLLALLGCAVYFHLSLNQRGSLEYLEQLWMSPIYIIPSILIDLLIFLYFKVKRIGHIFDHIAVQIKQFSPYLYKFTFYFIVLYMLFSFVGLFFAFAFLFTIVSFCIMAYGAIRLLIEKLISVFRLIKK